MKTMRTIGTIGTMDILFYKKFISIKNDLKKISVIKITTMSIPTIITVNIDDSAKAESSHHHHDIVENDDINLLKIILFIIKVQEDGRLPLKGEKYYDFWQILKSKNHTSVLLYKKYELELDEISILKTDREKICVYDKKYTEYINSQRICTKCTVDKNLVVDFSKNIKRDSGRRYICKECINQQQHEYQNTFDGCAKGLLNNTKNSAKSRGEKGRIGASEFT